MKKKKNILQQSKPKEDSCDVEQKNQEDTDVLHESEKELPGEEESVPAKRGQPALDAPALSKAAQEDDSLGLEDQLEDQHPQEEEERSSVTVHPYSGLLLGPGGGL